MPFDPSQPYEIDGDSSKGGFDPSAPYERAEPSKYSQFMKGQTFAPKDTTVALSDDPKKEYGIILPYAIDRATGKKELAFPEMIRAPVAASDRLLQGVRGQRPSEMSAAGEPTQQGLEDLVNVGSTGAGPSVAKLSTNMLNGVVRTAPVAADMMKSANAAVDAASKAKVIAPLMDYVAEKGGPKAPQDAATQEILRRLTQDVKGGGPTAQDMMDLHALTPEKGLTLADLGGENIKGLAGKLARAPGESKAVMSTIKDRQTGASEALKTDIEGNVSGGGPVFDRIQALMKSRSAAAKPAYEAAGIPSDPALYKSAPLVESPAVAEIIKKSADVRAAISAAKRLPDYADLPNNSMVLLDKAYKNIGGKANEAVRGGNGERGRDLNNLRQQLLEAITGGNPNHPYNKALQAFSGPSHSIDVVNLGKEHFSPKVSTPEKKAMFDKLSDTDKELYRLGAADSKINAVKAKVDAADKSKAVINSDRDREDFRVLFDSPDAAKKFEDSIAAERLKHDTAQTIFGNSKTAERVAEDGSPIPPIVANAGKATLAGVMGHPLAAGRHLFDAAMDYRRLADPARNAAMANILSEPLTQVSPGMKLLRDFAASSPQVSKLLSGQP